MEKSIKGTKTEKNLLTSFAGESQARMRYTYFASVAKKEGYEQIAAIFQETADQEKEHAKRMFKWLEGGMVEITASYPAGVISTTAENLKAAAAGENEEWTADYPRFADIADAEGFPAIAVMYRNIAVAEKGHELYYWLSGRLRNESRPRSSLTEEYSIADEYMNVESVRDFLEARRQAACMNGYSMKVTGGYRSERCDTIGEVTLLSRGKRIGHAALSTDSGRRVIYWIHDKN